MDSVSFEDQLAAAISLSLEEVNPLPGDVIGDGSCLTRAISQLLFGNQDTYRELREIAVSRMVNLYEYNGFIQNMTNGGLRAHEYIEKNYSGSIERYIEDMSRNGTWMTTVEVELLAHHFGVEFVVVDGGRADEPILYQTTRYGPETHVLKFAMNHYYV